MTTRDSLTKDIWRACGIMRSDGGTSGVLQYMEQLSWMLFLKAFEAIEDRYEKEAELAGAYNRIVSGRYRWSSWTKKDWAGEEIVKFVNQKLIPHLRNLGGIPQKDIVATVFQKIPGNRMESPYNLRDVIEIIDKIDFQNVEDTHIVSQVYEDLLLKMGQKGGVAGEFYTPRPVIRLMVKIINPKVGEKILDPFCGSCGFLVESYKHIKASKKLTTRDYEILQSETFYGQDKVP